MREVNRFATFRLDFFHLFLIKNVTQVCRLCGHFVSTEFNRWESELGLLHVVVDLLVEVLAHISLKDDGEVVSEPLAVATCVESEDESV